MLFRSLPAALSLVGVSSAGLSARKVMALMGLLSILGLGVATAAHDDKAGKVCVAPFRTRIAIRRGRFARLRACW